MRLADENGQQKRKLKLNLKRYTADKSSKSSR